MMDRRRRSVRGTASRGAAGAAPAARSGRWICPRYGQPRSGGSRAERWICPRYGQPRSGGTGAQGTRRGFRPARPSVGRRLRSVEIQRWRPASAQTDVPALEHERRTDRRAARAVAEPRVRDLRASEPSYGVSRSRRLRRVTKREGCAVSAVRVGEVRGVASGGGRVGAVRGPRADATSASA